MQHRLVERAAKAEKRRKYEAGEIQGSLQAEMAKVDIVLAKMFPLALQTL